MTQQYNLEQEAEQVLSRGHTLDLVITKGVDISSVSVVEFLIISLCSFISRLLLRVLLMVQ